MTMKTIHFVWLCLTIGLLVTVSSRPYRRFLRQRRQENPALTILIGTKRCEREGGFKFELPFEIEISTMGHMVMVSNLNCMISSKIKKSILGDFLVGNFRQVSLLGAFGALAIGYYQTAQRLNDQDDIITNLERTITELQSKNDEVEGRRKNGQELSNKGSTSEIKKL